MATKVRIKRSTTAAIPASLEGGELAYTSNGDILYIGSPTANTVTPIGGKRYPGQLTANQALVANSTSGIDKVIVGNLVPQAIYANNGFGTANYVLVTPGDGSNVFWESASAVGGVNTSAQYTFSNTITFNGSLVANSVNVTSTTVSSNTTTGAMTIAGGLGVAGRINTGDLAAGNDSVYSTLTGTTLTVANVFATATVNASVLSVGGWVIANNSGVFTSGVVNGDIIRVGTKFVANTTQVSLAQGMKLSANGALGSANQVLRTDSSGVAYWSDDLGDISAVSAGNGLTGGGTSGDITVSVLANNGIVANSTGLWAKQANGISVDASGINVVTGNGLSVNSSGVQLVTGSTLTVNSVGLHVNNTLSVTSVTTTGDLTVNGNTTLGDTSGDRLTLTALVSSNVNPAANNTYHLGNNSFRWAQVHAANVHGVTGTFDGNLNVAGDLVVSGNLTTVNVSSVSISDPIIYLAGNNYTSDILDIGFVANYSPDGVLQLHTGFYRDASDSGIWKLFQGSEQELSGNNTVNTAANGFGLAILQSYLQSSGLTTNATHIAITANSTVNVTLTANTLTLATPLAGTSGGTGLNTIANNDLIFGNTSNGFSKLSLGTVGKVLQSNGTAIVYDDIDGGTFA